MGVLIRPHGRGDRHVRAQTLRFTLTVVRIQFSETCHVEKCSQFFDQECMHVLKHYFKKIANEKIIR